MGKAGLGDRLASTVEVTYLDSNDVSDDSVDGDGIGEVAAGLKEPKVEVVSLEESFSHLPGGQTCQHCDNVSPRHLNLRQRFKPVSEHILPGQPVNSCTLALVEYKRFGDSSEAWTVKDIQQDLFM